MDHYSPEATLQQQLLPWPGFVAFAAADAFIIFAMQRPLAAI